MSPHLPTPIYSMLSCPFSTGSYSSDLHVPGSRTRSGSPCPGFVLLSPPLLRGRSSQKRSPHACASVPVSQISPPDSLNPVNFSPPPPSLSLIYMSGSRRSHEPSPFSLYARLEGSRPLQTSMGKAPRHLLQDVRALHPPQAQMQTQHHTKPTSLPHTSALRSANSTIPQHLGPLACTRALCCLLSTHWAATSPSHSCCHWSRPPRSLPGCTRSWAEGKDPSIQHQPDSETGLRNFHEEDGHLQKLESARIAREAVCGWSGLGVPALARGRGEPSEQIVSKGRT